MQISKLNDIFTTRGAAAALDTARAAMMDDWIIAKLEAGEWGVSHKSAPKPVKRDRIVDHHGDKRIVKTTLGTDALGYSVETLGESGNVVSREGLGKLSLSEARALIGKVIAHPVKEGGKTNDPKVSQGMKGSSTGGGNNKGGQKGK